MMGMRFQVGALQNKGASGSRYDFADRLPWAWACTQAQLECTCSKEYAAVASNDGVTAWGCTNWDAASSLVAGTVAGAVKAQFGGSPDMPAPESA